MTVVWPEPAEYLSGGDIVGVVGALLLDDTGDRARGPYTRAGADAGAGAGADVGVDAGAGA